MSDEKTNGGPNNDGLFKLNTELHQVTSAKTDWAFTTALLAKTVDELYDTVREYWNPLSEAELNNIPDSTIKALDELVNSFTDEQTEQLIKVHELLFSSIKRLQ